MTFDELFQICKTTIFKDLKISRTTFVSPNGHIKMRSSGLSKEFYINANTVYAVNIHLANNDYTLNMDNKFILINGYIAIKYDN